MSCYVMYFSFDYPFALAEYQSAIIEDVAVKEGIFKLKWKFITLKTMKFPYKKELKKNENIEYIKEFNVPAILPHVKLMITNL